MEQIFRVWCSFHLLSPCLVDLMLAFAFVSLISSKFNCTSSGHVPTVSLFERPGRGKMHFPIFLDRLDEPLAAALTNAMYGAVSLYRECEGCTWS